MECFQQNGSVEIGSKFEPHCYYSYLPSLVFETLKRFAVKFSDGKWCDMNTEKHTTCRSDFLTVGCNVTSSARALSPLAIKNAMGHPL
jgi:hypothetical protein